MNKDNITDFLGKNPFFWSRLGFCYDPPRAGKDGKQIIFSRDFEDYRRVHRRLPTRGLSSTRRYFTAAGSLTGSSTTP